MHDHQLVAVLLQSVVLGFRGYMGLEAARGERMLAFCANRLKANTAQRFILSSVNFTPVAMMRRSARQNLALASWAA